ncbi:MAG: hypothetical protein WBA22_19885 [Candidatus Methanofastidiosia archaeon]
MACPPHDRGLVKSLVLYYPLEPQRLKISPADIIQKSRSIKVACTKDPLTYKEIEILRLLIWKFFGQRKRLRFTLERNVDMEDAIQNWYSSTQFRDRPVGNLPSQYPQRLFRM